MAIVYGRYELLMLRDDTRAVAHAWVVSNVQAGSALIVGSDTMRFYASKASLEAETLVEPERLRASDRILAAGAAAAPVYNVYPLSATSTAKRAALIAAARAHPAPHTYFIVDSWFAAPDALGNDVAGVAEFAPMVEYPTHWLPVGGDLQMDPGYSLLTRLYATEYLGPTVTIYTVPKL